MLAVPLPARGAPTCRAREQEGPILPVAEDEADAALVRRAGQDPRAFGILYDRYCRPIYAYLCSRTGNPTIAEDLTSQTFFQALQGRPGIFGERGIRRAMRDGFQDQASLFGADQREDDLTTLSYPVIDLALLPGCATLARPPDFGPPFHGSGRRSAIAGNRPRPYRIRADACGKRRGS